MGQSQRLHEGGRLVASLEGRLLLWEENSGSQN